MTKYFWPAIGTGFLTLLVTGFLAFSFWIVGNTRMPVNFSLPPAGKTGKQAQMANPEQAEQRVFSFETVTDRPLFAPSRRPIIQASNVPIPNNDRTLLDAPKDLSPAIPDVALLGVMNGTQQAKALVQIANDKPTWISTQHALESWTVSEIGADWIELAFESQTIRVELYKQ